MARWSVAAADGARRRPMCHSAPVTSTQVGRDPCASATAVLSGLWVGSSRARRDATNVLLCSTCSPHRTSMTVDDRQSKYGLTVYLGHLVRSWVILSETGEHRRRGGARITTDLRGRHRCRVAHRSSTRAIRRRTTMATSLSIWFRRQYWQLSTSPTGLNNH